MASRYRNGNAFLRLIERSAVIDPISMRIVCPNCDTPYSVPDGKIGAKGRDVRCARCGTRWHAAPPRDPAPVAPPRPLFAETAEEAAPVPAGADEAPLDRVGLFDFDRPDRVESRPLAAVAAPAPAARIPAADPGEPAEDEEEIAAVAPAPAKAEAPVETAPLPPSPPPAGPAEAPAGPAGPAAEPGDKPADVESLARRPAIKLRKTRPRALRLPQIDYRATYTHAKPWLGLGLFVLAILLPLGAIVMRSAVVDALPSMAGLYRAIGLEVNLRGLVFENVETQRELEAGQPVLVVEGQVTNPTDDVRPLPSIRLSLRGDDRQEIYAWSVDPKATSVAPGASVRFRTKLAAPPDDARDVQIRFTERRSRQAAHP